MNAKFKLGLLLMVFAGAFLTSGCEKKKNVIVEKEIEKKAASKKAEQMDKKTVAVKLKTNMGDIIIELNEELAPVTVENFLTYVEKGFYDETIFHRIIAGFMIQGGGFEMDMARKQTHSAIVNEAENGLKNNRGTIAMARTNNPNSATSQFFINHKDNPNLDYIDSRNPGYAVFGKVVEGMDVVDKIASVKTTVRRGMRDVPAEPVVVRSAKIVTDF